MLVVIETVKTWQTHPAELIARRVGFTGRGEDVSPCPAASLALWRVMVVAGTDGRCYGSWRAGVSCVRANSNPGPPPDPVYADRTV